MQDLIGGAKAGADSGVDRSPVAGGVGVLAGEVERVVGGDSHLTACVERAGGYVAVGAPGKCVALPIVRVATDELLAECLDWQREDGGEGFTSEFAELAGSEVDEGFATRAACPAGDGVGRIGMGRPPDGRDGGEGEEEAEIAPLFVWCDGVSPDLFAEDESEAKGVAHAKAVGFVDGIGDGDEGD